MPIVVLPILEGVVQATPASVDELETKTYESDPTGNFIKVPPAPTNRLPFAYDV